ncbi:MAG: 2-phospho-L-lactate guanylyltransferase [Acidobacteriota bacterium]|nr:2-phospho-L-lactate guanylyltransferase [Acidobacteriota bacterium]
MPTAAIVPVKRFGAAKQRLDGALDGDQRESLARAMVADVLAALRACAALAATIVVTADERAAAIALECGALLEPDASESGQSDAVAQGVARALRDGFRRVLCVPGDCPTLHPGEVGALLAASTGPPHDDACVLIVPDRHGTGTNALLLSPPDAIAPSFGPDSFTRHRDLAGEAGVTAVVMRPPSLLLDVDTGADLDALRRRLADAGSRARATRAVLAQTAPGQG